MLLYIKCNECGVGDKNMKYLFKKMIPKHKQTLRNVLFLFICACVYENDDVVIVQLNGIRGLMRSCCYFSLFICIGDIIWLLEKTMNVVLLLFVNKIEIIYSLNTLVIAFKKFILYEVWLKSDYKRSKNINIKNLMRLRIFTKMG